MNTTKNNTDKKAIIGKKIVGIQVPKENTLNIFFSDDTSAHIELQKNKITYQLVTREME
ncbi:MAG: hypothetical protein HPY70_02315 [Firmicutes bacterium]|nr:hypothetical protein [Bacillota bacterium]